MVSRPSRSQSVSKVPVSRIEWDVSNSNINKQVTFASNGASGLDVRHRRSQSSLRPSSVPPREDHYLDRHQLVSHHATSTAGTATGTSSGVPSHVNLLSPISNMAMAATLSQTRRAVSEVGTSSYDDPEEVARAILDLRQKREKQQQQHRSTSRSKQRRTTDKQLPHQQSQQLTQQLSQGSERSASNSRTRPPAPPPPQQDTNSNSNSIHQQPLHLHRTYSQHSNASSQENCNPCPLPGTTAESDRASQSIRQAEQRIDGLLQELEDLRFFQEIDQTTHSANAPTPQKTLGAIRGRSTSIGGDNNNLIDTPPNPNNPPARPLKTPKGDFIPTVIRATSPHPGQRLPPPPNNLSPRKIARMDRTTLELETQTLVRQVQVLQRDQQILEDQIQTLKESQKQNNNKDEQSAAQTKKIKQLESNLHQLSKQLQSAKADMDATKTALEKQVAEQQLALERSTRKMEALQAERDKIKSDLEAKQRDFKAAKNKWKEDLRTEIESLASREAVLELQLSEVQTDLLEYKQKYSAQQQEMERLKNVANAHVQSNEEAYQVRLNSLQEELSLAHDKLKKAVGENTSKSKKIKDYSEQLESAKKQSDEQLGLISDMTERLDTIHAEYREKFSELKQIYENKEKRRLDEMVESHTGQNKEYERRLLALQEQLKHANDRHYEELRQQMEEHEKQLRAQSELLTAQHKDALARVQQELESVRAKYDQTQAERTQLQDELQHQVEKPKTELEKCEKEISRLEQKSESLTQLVAEKDSQINDLTNRLSESESRHISQLSLTEAHHEEALIAKDEVIATQKREFRVLEVQLRNELSGKEAELASAKAELDTRVGELQQELSKTKGALNAAEDSLAAKRDLEKTVQDLQETIARMQGELATERSAHEKNVTDMRVEIARLEGKLRAGESALKQKRDLVEELEAKLRQASMGDKDALEQTQRQLDRARQVFQRELAESSERHSFEIADWEKKLKKETEALQEARNTISKIQGQVRALEDERATTASQVKQLQVQLEEANAHLSEYERRVEQCDSLESQLELKSKHADNVSEKFTGALKQLQDELEAERKSKGTLLLKVRDLEADLDLKEHQIRRLPKLQEQLKDLISGREELQGQLGKVEAELERKEKQIKQASERYAESQSEFYDKLDEMKKGKDSLESQLRLVEQELHAKTERADRISRQASELMNELNEKVKIIDETKQQLSHAESELQRLRSQLAEAAGASDFSVELQSKVEQLTKAKAMLESKVQELEDERDEREKQVRHSSERYSNQIVDLQMQVEELSRAKASILSRLSQAEAELEKKDDMMSVTSSQHSGDLNTLHNKLVEQLEQKKKLEAKLRSVEARLAEKERSSQKRADQQATEIQLKYEAGVKECRALRLKIGDVEAELERKEKQIKDIVNRYSKEIAELKDKLEDESRANFTLRRDADQLRGDACSVSSMSFEANALKDRLSSVEKSLEVERALARDADNARVRLEEDLVASEKARQELEARFDKANSERTEVITALEEVIHEVQSREEEIESLAHILRKRDEELEHAKLIATKALASAQELKSRYQDRGSSRQAELNNKISELNQNLDFLSDEKEELLRRNSRLEEQLRAREAEVTELKTKFGKQEASSRISLKIDKFMALKDRTTPKDHSPTGSDGSDSFSDAASYDFNDAGSTEMTSSSGWLQNFDSGSTDSGDNGSYAGVRTEPVDMSSRRSIERDALRKYVRKRYLKSKGSV